MLIKEVIEKLNIVLDEEFKKPLNTRSSTVRKNHSGTRSVIDVAEIQDWLCKATGKELKLYGDKSKIYLGVDKSRHYLKVKRKRSGYTRKSGVWNTTNTDILTIVSIEVENTQLEMRHILDVYDECIHIDSIEKQNSKAMEAVKIERFKAILKEHNLTIAEYNELKQLEGEFEWFVKKDLGLYKAIK